MAEQTKTNPQKEKLDTLSMLQDFAKKQHETSLNPYQQGVMKGLIKAGEQHATEALQGGVPADHIVQQSGVAMQNSNQELDSIQQQAQDIALPAKSIFGKMLESTGAGQVWENNKLSNLQKAQKIIEGPQPTISQQIKLMSEDEKKQNASDIADGIESGNQLADFKSLYGLAGPVKAELQRRGVDVSKLQLQATAETKLAQTLNGPQQVRLRQSVDSVLQGLDELDSLNEEFQRTGIKAFNRAKLEILANGGGTPEQQDLAQRFKTQMIGLQDEFGNVVMAGNSPTDRALELSGKIFSSDFNNTSISGATKQMRRLLSMRKTAIDNVGSNSGQSSNNSVVNSVKEKSGGYSDFLKSIGK